MTQWTLLLLEPSYESIRMGRKTVEGRAPDPTKPAKEYGRINPGDIVAFQAIDADKFEPIPDLPLLRFLVEFNHHYRSQNAEHAIRMMFLNEGLHTLLPKARSIEDGIKTYLDLPGYPQRIEKYGICAIGLGARVR